MSPRQSRLSYEPDERVPPLACGLESSAVWDTCLTMSSSFNCTVYCHQGVCVKSEEHRQGSPAAGAPHGSAPSAPLGMHQVQLSNQPMEHAGKQSQQRGRGTHQIFWSRPSRGVMPDAIGSWALISAGMSASALALALQLSFWGAANLCCCSGTRSTLLPKGPAEDKEGHASLVP